MIISIIDQIQHFKNSFHARLRIYRKSNYFLAFKNNILLEQNFERKKINIGKR